MILSNLKKLNYRHYICVFLTVVFLLCGFFFQESYIRILSAFKDFGLSFAYYFCELFRLSNNIVPSVTDMPPIQIDFPTTLPDFQAGIGDFGTAFISEQNVSGYFNILGKGLYNFANIFALFFPVVVMLVVLIKMRMKQPNNNYNLDTKPLKLFRRLSRVTYSPVRKFVSGMIDFLKEQKVYLKLWLFIFLLHLNAITILLELIAYLVYFSVSIDFSSLYTQFYRLVFDILIPLRIVPIPAWVIFALIMFDRFRKKIAYSVLRHYEMRNRGFINSMPVVFMTVGTMGKKKTTMMTDMALSQAVMFRDKAFELLYLNDLKFPYFSWINFELELRAAMQSHDVYNLATCRAFVARKRKTFEAHQLRSYCFGYDFYRYGLTYDDKLKVVGLFDVLETYAQLYFIYVLQSSLLLSNYSIRTDNILSDTGNFPLWNNDFFARDSKMQKAYSRYAHILDFDMLRLGRKLIENNLKSDVFDFGVVVLTEGGKERGNQVENQGMKKTDDSTNRKNDLFNLWLKMVRHSATVDNFPFVKVLIDEQRPESMGADVRELCEIIHIRDSSDTALTLPFFFLENLIYDFLFPRFNNFYYELRHLRGDNTLSGYFFKSLTAKIQAYYSRIYNTYGYCRLSLETEKGVLDGELDSYKYYIMSKKIYSKRFSTDCFSDYFAEKAISAPVGLADLETYLTDKATFDELRLQNSYFIDDLLSNFDSNKKGV